MIEAIEVVAPQGEGGPALALFAVTLEQDAA